MATVTVNTNYVVQPADSVVLVNATGGPIQVSIPSVHITGKRIIVKDRNGVAATNNITIVSLDGDTIDNGPTATLTSNNQAILIHSDGTNWFVL